MLAAWSGVPRFRAGGLGCCCSWGLGDGNLARWAGLFEHMSAAPCFGWASGALPVAEGEALAAWLGKASCKAAVCCFGAACLGKACCKAALCCFGAACLGKACCKAALCCFGAAWSGKACCKAAVCCFGAGAFVWNAAAALLGVAGKGAGCSGTASWHGNWAAAALFGVAGKGSGCSGTGTASWHAVAAAALFGVAGKGWLLWQCYCELAW